MDNATIHRDPKSVNLLFKDEIISDKGVWIDFKSGKPMGRCHFCGRIGEIVHKFGKREPGDGSYSFRNALRM